MKLKINGFENEIIFDDDYVNVLSIVTPKCFSHILEVINNKINGIESNEIFLLDNEENEMKFDKEICFFSDYFNVDYNSKKVLNSLYKIIADNIKLRQDFKIEEISFNLRNYIIEEINELPFEFVMEDELDVVDILKLYNLKIDGESCATILERIENFISIISTLKIAKIIVFANLKSFLSEEDLLELYKFSLYNNVNILLIERECNKKFKYEKLFVIDDNFDDYVINNSI